MPCLNGKNYQKSRDIFAAVVRAGNCLHPPTAAGRTDAAALFGPPRLRARSLLVKVLLPLLDQRPEVSLLLRGENGLELRPERLALGPRPVAELLAGQRAGPELGADLPQSAAPGLEH